MVKAYCLTCGFATPVSFIDIGDGNTPNNVTFSELLAVAWDGTNKRILVLDGNQVKEFQAEDGGTNASLLFSFCSQGHGTGQFSGPSDLT